MPDKGLGYGAFRYAGSAEQRDALRFRAGPSVVFNYLGQFDGSFDERSLWTPAAESAGPQMDPRTVQSHEFSVGGQVFDGELRLNVRYSTRRHRRETVQAWVTAFEQELDAVITHCLSGVRGTTPSDFPLLASVSRSSMRCRCRQSRSRTSTH